MKMLAYFVFMKVCKHNIERETNDAHNIHSIERREVQNRDVWINFTDSFLHILNISRCESHRSIDGTKKIPFPKDCVSFVELRDAVMR